MLCVPVFAQYDAHLTGHVLDERTGEHLPFVNVQVKGTNIGTVTDESGHYFLRDMPIGKQTIVFSYVGYETLELPVTMVEDKTIELKATIREVSQQLNSVVVTANRYATKRQETATIVNVLSPDLFQTTAVSCVADVLSFQPGLRVENSCSNCGKTDLRINGLQGQYTQILMDSRPVFSSMASVYGLEQVPAAMIDRIEVVRGGGSAVYGANAIAGVVNIITKEPVRNFVNISNVSNINEHAGYDINTELNASVMSENRKIGAYLFAAHRSRSPYDRDEDGFSEVPKLRSTTAGARVFFKTSAYSKITAEYHHTTDFRRGGNRFDLGMLCYFPQIWASDNTDAICRATIQEGYSYGYPQSCVGAHVSAVPNHQTLRKTPMETRFAVAAFGVLGYECDMRDIDAANRDRICGHISIYKKWRDVLQFGQFYRVLSGNIHEWICVSGDKTRAVGLLLQELTKPNIQSQRFVAAGLDPKKRYRFYNISERVDIKQFGSLVNTVTPIHVRQDSLVHNVIARAVRMNGENEDVTASGEILMRTGVALRPAYAGTGFNENVRIFPDFAARLYFFEEVKHEEII